MNEQAHQPSREPSKGEFVYRDTLMRVESLPAPPRASACPDRDGSAPSRGLSGVFRRLPMMRRAVGGRASTATPGTAGALARSGRCVAAGLLLAFVALLALLPEAQAQTTIENAAANSAPIFNEGTSTSREFNETIGEATVTTASDIGTAVAATDMDTGDTLEYSLSGTDAAKFTVDTGNGQIKINRLQVQNLFRLRFLDDATNVVLVGGVGLGKSHLVTATPSTPSPPPRPPGSSNATCAATSHRDC